MIQKAYFETAMTKSVPTEKKGSLLFGLLCHLGPPILFCVAAQLFHFHLLQVIVTLLSIGALYIFILLFTEKMAPAIQLVPNTWRTVARGLENAFIEGAGLGGLVIFIGWWGLKNLFSISIRPNSWVLILLAVALTDFIYYFIHRYLNHGKNKGGIKKLYRISHGHHHSIEAMDFLRGNLTSVLDTAVAGFQVPLVLVSALLGLSFEATVVAYGLVLMLQITHHVNHNFNIGYLGYIFVDNHSHKFHHCPGGQLVNFAALFSFYDRIFGTFYDSAAYSASHMAKFQITLPIRSQKMM